MLCLNCKYALDPSRENVVQVVSELVKGIENEDERRRMLTELTEMYLTTAQSMKTSYKVVKICLARKSIVVGNPERKTQSITECGYYEQI